MSAKLNRDQEDKAYDQATEQVKELPAYVDRNKLLLKQLGLYFTENTKMRTYAPYNKEKRYLVDVGSLDEMVKGDRGGVTINLQVKGVDETSVTFAGEISYYPLAMNFASIPTNNPELLVSVCNSFIFTHSKVGEVMEAVSLDFEDSRQNSFESCFTLDGGASILVLSDVATAIIRGGVISLVGDDVKSHSVKFSSDHRPCVTVETTVDLGVIEPVIDYNKNPEAMNKLFAEHMGGIKLTKDTLCLDNGETINDMPLVKAHDFDWSHSAEFISNARARGTTQLTEGRILHEFYNRAVVCDADKNALLYIPVYELHGAEFNEKTGMVLIYGHETIHSFALDDFSTIDVTYTR